MDTSKSWREGAMIVLVGLIVGLVVVYWEMSQGPPTVSCGAMVQNHL